MDPQKKEENGLTENKVKVEFQRGRNKVTLTVEGDDSPFTEGFLSTVLSALQPALKDQSIGSMNPQHDHSQSQMSYTEMTTKERVKHLVRTYLKHSWFDSKEVLELYRHYLDDEVPPSTISTYLGRLTKENVLERRGSRKNLHYRLKPSQLEIIPEIQISPMTND